VQSAMSKCLAICIGDIVYSDEEEDIRGTAEAIKDVIISAMKTDDIKKIKNYLNTINSMINAIIEDVDRMAKE